MTESAPTTTCPTCGAAAHGNFCASCGSPLTTAHCAKCDSELSPGARFCHRCGAPAAAAAPARASVRATPETGLGSRLPWAVAGVALLALIALVAFQRSTGAGADSPALAAENGAPAPAGGAAGVDINSMSPEERAERLFNRVMSYSERGKTDSVQIFAPMAIAAYEMLGALSTDQRYDLGRIAAVSGDAQIATAQADSILQANPTHLLGLVLAADAARMRKDDGKTREYLQRLAAAEQAERAKKLPEYEAHANDIDAALAQAQKK